MRRGARRRVGTADSVLRPRLGGLAPFASHIRWFGSSRGPLKAAMRCCRACVSPAWVLGRMTEPSAAFGSFGVAAFGQPTARSISVAAIWAVCRSGKLAPTRRAVIRADTPGL